jgi:pimeloyl-ACP methyl ester carboxylesterase
MKLNYREFGEGKPLLILHGLFGFSDNWQTHAKRFSDYFRVITVDLRNHGKSPWSDEVSYGSMADDVIELCHDLGLNSIYLLGHSMGGKVAMHLVQKEAELVEKLIVVDIGVKEYPPHHKHILEGIHAVTLEGVESRKTAEIELTQHISSPGIIQFLLKNLQWEEKGRMSWKMNVEALERNMHSILAEVPFSESFVPTLFIRGELSNYILDEDTSTLEAYFPDSEVVTIDNAGHWVHAEAPDVFIEIVLTFLLR